MARNFGFEPTETQPYYFISYNSGDASRVGAIAREMHARGIPVWYDRGLKTGDEWEKQIALKIKKCHEMVMFVTSKLMMRENPYVRKEYSLARNYHKKIHIVYVDNIAFENVNLALQGWFVGLEYLHSVQVFQLDSVIQIVDALDDQIHFVRKKPKARDDIVKKKLTASKPQQAFADTEKSASKPQQASARTEKAVPKPPQTSVSTEKAVAKPQQASVSTEKAVSKLHQTSVRTEKAVPKPQQTSGYTEKASPKPQQNSIKEEKNTAKQQKSTIQLLSSAHKVLTGKGVRLFVFLALIALLIPAGVITIPHIRTALLSNENVSQSDTEHRDQESKEYDIRQIIPDYDPADYDDPTLYTYLENDDGTLKITGHAEQNVSEMKIPPLMDGKPVTAIAAYAFSGYFNLQKIEIPLTVSFI